MIHHYLTHTIPTLQTLHLGYLQTQTTANATPRKNSARAYPVTLAILRTDNTSREGRTQLRSEEIIRPMQDGRERKIQNKKGPTLVKTKGNGASDIAWRRISARARNRAGLFKGTKRRHTTSSQGELQV